MFDDSTRKLNHIHTWRCGHASDELEEAYLQKAVELHAEEICFSDHAPFPGNPFRNRMQHDQLEEYVSTLQALREKYEGIIDVKIGLEIEYLPSFRWYYEELLASGHFDFLMMGQHFYELPDGRFSFQLKDRTGEDRGVMEAVCRNTVRILYRGSTPGLSLPETEKVGAGHGVYVTETL